MVVVLYTPISVSLQLQNRILGLTRARKFNAVLEMVEKNFSSLPGRRFQCYYLFSHNSYLDGIVCPRDLYVRMKNTINSNATDLVR